MVLVMRCYGDKGWVYTPEEEKRAQLCPIGLHIECKYCTKFKFKRCKGRNENAL